MKNLFKFNNKVIKFFLHNNCKKMTISVLGYTLFYRICILIMPNKILEKMLGEKGMETLYDESAENLDTARHIASLINYIAPHTPWESKCLVCAMTTQKILDNHGIRSTLYLGLKKEDNSMVAHAWLRCGPLYLTGGNGNGYATVAKYTK